MNDISDFQIGEEVHARHLVELGYVERFLQEYNFPTLLIERNEQVPIHSLIISLAEDTPESDSLVQYNFIPIDTDLEAVALLQIYHLFAVEPRREVSHDLMLFLLSMNSKLPIGHLGINDEEEVFFRYIYPKSKNNLVKQTEISEISLMFIGICKAINPIINSISTGEFSIHEALTQLEALGLY